MRFMSLSISLVVVLIPPRVPQALGVRTGSALVRVLRAPSCDAEIAGDQFFASVSP
jgi:hypothetical protein